MSIEGTFVHATNVNYEAWLKVVGAKDDVIPKICAVKPTIVISKTSDGVTLKTTTGDKTFTNTITFGKDSPVEIAGITYTTNVTATASGYSGSVKIGGKTGTVLVEASATGCTQTLVLEGETAKRTFSRQ